MSELKTRRNFQKTEGIFRLLPEYNGKELVPVFASFYIPENVLVDLSKRKIYGMAMKEDTMDILNPEFKNSNC